MTFNLWCEFCKYRPIYTYLHACITTVLPTYYAYILFHTCILKFHLYIYIMCVCVCLSKPCRALEINFMSQINLGYVNLRYFISRLKLRFRYTTSRPPRTAHVYIKITLFPSTVTLFCSPSWGTSENVWPHEEPRATIFQKYRPRKDFLDTFTLPC